MARRRKKQGGDLVPFVVIVVMIAGFSGVFNITHSVSAGLIAAAFVLVIFYVAIFLWRANQSEKLKRSGITEIDQMDGIQFEHYLGQLFKAHGYAVEVTRSTGDYGADLVLKKDGKKIVVQAKRYKQKVGLTAVQEVIGSKAVYGATEAWVITNSDFTDPAINLAKVNGVRMLNRGDLIDMILKMNLDVVRASSEVAVTVQQPKYVQAETNDGELICKRCGKPMVLRKGKLGEFYGCSSFPKCRNTMEITDSGTLSKS